MAFNTETTTANDSAVVNLNNYRMEQEDGDTTTEISVKVTSNIPAYYPSNEQVEPASTLKIKVFAVFGQVIPALAEVDSETGEVTITLRDR